MLRALDQVDHWPVTTAGVGVVTRDGGLVASTGDLDRELEWASITKLLTAYAVLIALEEGTVDLDQPAGPPGSTLRHLLAHASGLAPERRTPMAAVGRRRIYSNAGIELAAETLAASADMAFWTYVTEAVLQPLGMLATRMVATPANGAVSPTRDLLTFAAELLTPTLVSAATLAMATTVQFPGLNGVLPGFGRQHPNDWGVGFELRDHKAPHWTGTTNSPATFGHFGRAGGVLGVDPRAGVAWASLSDRDFGPWAAAAWPPLADAILAELAGR